ncbi:MAG: hypothetical protein WEA04_01370 [Candidatus Andersenbacteria bacterium]
MNRKTLITGLAIVAVIFIAAGFRLYDIHHYPPGLFPDQAANGEDVRLILEGDVRPFYPRGNGREGLFFLLQAVAVNWFGGGVWPLLATSAVVGILTVGAVFFATRIFFGRLSGILAALFLATNHWHVTLSRTGFRAILIPLFVAAFTAFVGYAVAAAKQKKTSRSLVYAVLAGACFMGGFYTYIAYRIMVGVVLGMLLLMLLAALHPQIGFPHLRRYRWQLVAAVVAGCLVFLPLGLYFWHHPDAFVGRAGQVSVFNQDLQNQYGGGQLVPTILYSLRATLLSFFVGPGDLNWRHAVPGFPLLNPLVGLLFLLGLAWTIHGTVMVAYKLRRGEEEHLGFVYPYLLLLLLGMLVPVITTAEGLPHGLRSIGLAVPIFMLAGTAGSVCLYWIKRKLPLNFQAAGVGLAVGAVLVAAAYDGALYFLIARNDSAAYYAYRGDLTEVAAFINEHHARFPDAPRPYLVLDPFSLQTIHYLTAVAAHDHVVGDEVHPDEAQHTWVQLDPATSERTTLQAEQIIIFTQSTIVDADRYGAMHPEVEVVASRRNRWGKEILRVYQRAGTSPPAEEIDSLDA